MTFGRSPKRFKKNSDAEAENWCRVAQNKGRSRERAPVAIRQEPESHRSRQNATSESGLTLYRIAKDTGVVKTCLIRFMRGETSLRLDKADVLAEYLGLELTRRKAK
jgi:hypothetical protein